MKSPKFPTTNMIVFVGFLSLVITIIIDYFIDTKLPDFSSKGFMQGVVIFIIAFFVLRGVLEIISGKLNNGKIDLLDFFK